MAHLLAQPHQNYNKLQTKDHLQLSEIELNGNPTTTELKKPHQLSTVGDTEACRHRTGRSHTHLWWVKTQEGYLGSEGSQLHIRPPSPGYQCQEEKPPKLVATKTNGFGVGEKKTTGFPGSSS